MPADQRLQQLLASYPRSRPPLSREHQATYVEHYRANRSGEGLSKVVMKLESWMHRSISADSGRGAILEIGAGNLNHAPYCPAAASYDAIEPFRGLWEDSPHRRRVRSIYADITEIPEQPAYDQILSVAVMEHLTDLPFVLARSGLLLREGGSFRAGFPSEGGFLWGMAWRCTTGVAYRWKRRLDYGSIMRHEHVNDAAEILALLRYFYAQVEVKRFPYPARHLSFYTTAVARLPQVNRCKQWAAFRASAPAGL